jgi:hypothetical protein
MVTVARGGVLAVLGALGFMLGRKAATGPLAGHECTGRGYCRGCGRLDTCGLPAALSVRESAGGKGSIP